MHACGGGYFNGGGMLRVLGADGKHIHFLLLQHFSQIGVAVDAEFLAKACARSAATSQAATNCEFGIA